MAIKQGPSSPTFIKTDDKSIRYPFKSTKWVVQTFVCPFMQGGSDFSNRVKCSKF